MRRELNVLEVFPEPDRSALMVEFQCEIRRKYEAEGMRAFEMPRTAAIAHETGHAIVFAHDGVELDHVEIFSKTLPALGTTWAGLTQEKARHWMIGPDTPVREVLQRAGFMIAGECGEAVLDLNSYRSATSIDEVIGSQAIIAGYASKSGVRPEPLWQAVRRRSMLIIKHNEELARELMARLALTQSIRAGALQSILARVERLPDKFDRLPGDN